MIPRSLKAAYYHVLSVPMRASSVLYKATRAPRSGVVKVHLGPGQMYYLPGWINVDANRFTAKIDVWANFTDPLPFHDGTVDVVYTQHTIEHLPDHYLPTFCREIFRCLKPGGVLRIGGPNTDAAVRKYLEGDASWFVDFPDAHTSLGGKLVNFVFCRGEHLTLLTPSYFEELLGGAGFEDVRTRGPVTDTGFPEFIDAAVLATEREATPEAPHTLVMEARKPS